MQIPSFKKGDKLWAADLQSLADAVRANRVLPGVGIRITGSPNGTTVAANIPRASMATVATAHLPFQLIVTTDPDDTSETPVPMIRIIPSTLAGGSATDLGFSDGDDPPYLLSMSSGKLVGGISFDPTTLVVSARWLEIKTTVPAPDAEAGTAYVEIGTVNATTLTATNSRYGPISVSFCRDWYQQSNNVTVVFS